MSMNPASFKTLSLDGTDGVTLEFCPYKGHETKLAVGCLDGSVFICEASLDTGLSVINKFHPLIHPVGEVACIRTVAWFHREGQKAMNRMLISDNFGKVYLMNTNTGEVVWKVITTDDTAGSGVSGLCQVGDYHVATGDDMGVLNIWDIRKEYGTEDPDSEWLNLEFLEGEYPITKIEYTDSPPEDARYKTKIFTGASLLVSGGPHIAQFHLDLDGKIMANPNEPDFGMSDPLDGDCGRFSISPSKRIVISGDDEGFISLWKWGNWGACSSRTQLEESLVSEEGLVINDVFTYDDFIGLAACSDGSVRILVLYPLADAGTIGEHWDGGAIVGSEEHTSCEYMALNHNYDTIATLGLNQQLQIMALKPDVIEAAVAQKRSEGGVAVRNKKKLTEEEEKLADQARGASGGFFGAL